MSYGSPTGNQGYPDPTNYDDDSSTSDSSFSSSGSAESNFDMILYYLFGLAIIIAIFCTVFFTIHPLAIPIVIFIVGLMIMGVLTEGIVRFGFPIFYLIVMILGIIMIIGGNLLRWKINF